MGNEAKLSVRKDERRVTLRTYKPSDKEGLVSMYAGLSQESLRWSMPPYNRERIERMTTDLENRIILRAFHSQKGVGHLQISLATNARFRGTGDLFIYRHQYFQKPGLGAAFITERSALALRPRVHRYEFDV